VTTDPYVLPANLSVPEDDGAVTVFYPMFPPDRSAADVVAWPRERA
jgi:hypothetical protein